MAKQHRIAGVALVLLGAYVSIYSFTVLDIGTVVKPGSGFFTLLCGAGILLLSALWLLLGRKERDDTPMWEPAGWKLPLLAIAVSAVYAWLMVPLGYLLSTAVFIVLWQLLIAHGKPRTVIIFTIVGTGAMYLCFERLLRVPLPNGPLPF